MKAHEKQIELVCHVLADVPDRLAGDSVRLRQVLVNLVSNAIKFTDEGEVVIRVTLESQTSEGVVLHFAVRDTGIGIPREKQALLFKAFSQVDGSAARKYGGTGLGLAISARLVQMMGGRIWVQSEPSEGSTFHFTAVLQPAQSPTIETPGMELGALRGVRALIVDDNATNRRILLERLTGWEMAAVAVESGRKALAAMEDACRRGEPFSIVLLDGMMPGMDGFALAEEIQRHPDLAGATLMMLSSGDRREDASRCKELGVAAYLVKPIRQAELLRALSASVGAAMRVTRPDRTRQGRAASSRRLRLLLAEDNLVNQRLAVGLLQKQGHEVTVVDDGRKAIAALRERPFDAVLMDVQMPGMDGLAATAAIREEERASGRHIPIIAMTAHAMTGDRQRCLDAGMDGYISKPIRADELFAALDRLLGTGATTADNERGAAPEESAVDWSRTLIDPDADRELLRAMVEAFLEEGPRLVAQLRQAIDDGNADQLRLTAHTLKGSLRYFRGGPVIDVIEELEHKGRDRQWTGVDALAETIKAEVARTTAAMRAYVRGSSAGVGEQP
jgi:CheY-like chemotaxis protein/HPt (histidine-containing phosphotransfer) domain-containing protein